ncbi:MAG TPA: hypothetical protein DCP61_00620 [Treponema sp.]|nr:hypothetical protein [Treponema sp.]
MATHQKHPPGAAGIGAPLVPAEGRDEPRKTEKCVKPRKNALLGIFSYKFSYKNLPSFSAKI